MAKKKKFSEMTGPQRAGVVALATAQIALSVWAGRDLKDRPADQVRGPKLLWGLALPIQPFGPVGYLAFGRKR
ncbi:hypothetical protein ACLM5J_06595 [Nocardioides sp. Bht2]|uniref:hypothetical protein n=1 Tax=Nocardioides sp. Bht2 TaxID=3392297 RepID=UPI0039B36EA7